jgi:hypothetical protein
MKREQMSAAKFTTLCRQFSVAQAVANYLPAP